MGPFPTALRQLKFLVVGIDYFTKWVEAEPLATIMEKSIHSFVWRNIICKYGIPRVLVSDNGKQFDNSAFREGNGRYQRPFTRKARTKLGRTL